MSQNVKNSNKISQRSDHELKKSLEYVTINVEQTLTKHLMFKSRHIFLYLTKIRNTPHQNHAGVSLGHCRSSSRNGKRVCQRHKE